VVVEPSVGADGVYGRFDGDLDFGVGLGGEVEQHATRAAVRASLHYFWTAGVYASYRDALGRDDPDAQLASVGVDLRPLFMPRWSEHWETGPALAARRTEAAHRAAWSSGWALARRCSRERAVPGSAPAGSYAGRSRCSAGTRCPRSRRSSGTGWR
jgi:hypothetical protein